MNNEPVVIITNNTKPSIDIQPTPSPSTPSQSIKFSIAVKKLVERNRDGVEVDSFSLESSELIFDITNSTLGDSSNVAWVYSTVLENGAMVNITVS